MSNYRAYEVSGKGEFTLAERPLTDPRPGQVRLRVESCGVCHTDIWPTEGRFRNPDEPMVPGHEVIGVIDALGEGVAGRQVGDRVGVGFLHGHCGTCESCRRGDFVGCGNQLFTGVNVDGGFAEVLYAQASGLVAIPEGSDPLETAPLLCAGITVHNALRKLTARPGALVAVQGIGGLGHLALQYAGKLGFRVVAVARGKEKEETARSLGADVYIDSSACDVAEELQKLGGATAIIATSPQGSSISALMAGLTRGGTMMVVGAGFDPVSVDVIADLLVGGRTLVGNLTGSPVENEDNLRFAVQHGIKPIVQVMPFRDAPKALERVAAGQARYRVVLDMNS